jgi:hypothetical protein
MSMKNQTPQQQVKPPGRHLLALEWRAPLEATAAFALWPILLNGPRGDGHTVLVFPGLAAPDSSTGLLRTFLRHRGYEPQRWEQGFNLGPRPGVLEASLRRVHELSDRSGRTISLIGWSLGGVYARELAKLAPGRVRCVISLGSPFAGSPKASNAWRLYECISGKRADDAEAHACLKEAPPVPTTSIYSRSDGVVSWKCSVQEIGEGETENIEVIASHTGMAMNPAVLLAIADRLAQPEGAWSPFKLHGFRRFVYGSVETGR